MQLQVGLVYNVQEHGRAGVTGQRTSMESRLEGLLSQLHSVTDKSIAVGFGVSGPSQVFSLIPWILEVHECKLG